MQNFVAMMGVILMVLSILVLLFSLFVIVANAIWESSCFYSLEITDMFIASILLFIMGIVAVAVSSAIGG